MNDRRQVAVIIPLKRQISQTPSSLPVARLMNTGRNAYVHQRDRMKRTAKAELHYNPAGLSPDESQSKVMTAR
jgi:hypothetical protein